MNNENCEPRICFTTQRGRQGFALILPCLHVFLAHPHLGGGWRAERDGRGNLGVGFQLLYPLIYNPFDFHTDFFEVEVDLTIIEADDLDVIAFEKDCPLPVVSFFFFGVMLAAVQFYNQADLRTVEIADIVAYDFLPVEAEAVFSEGRGTTVFFLPVSCFFEVLSPFPIGCSLRASCISCP